MIDALEQRRRMRERQKRVLQNIRYRQGVRDMDNAGNKVQQLIQSFSSMAVEKEKAGEHAQAVQLAAKARQLANYHSSSGSMRAQVEAGHALGTISQAMGDMLRASGGLMEKFIGFADPAALSQAQIGMQVMNENLALLMQEGEWAALDLEDGAQGTPSEAAEAFLRQIMADAGKEKRASLLKDTGKQLDRLKQIRAEEK